MLLRRLLKLIKSALSVLHVVLSHVLSPDHGERADEIVLDLLDLEQDTGLVVRAKGLELVIRVPPHHLLDLAVEALGFLVLFALTLHANLIVKVVRKDVHLCVLIQAATACLTHQSGESL